MDLFDTQRSGSHNQLGDLTPDPVDEPRADHDHDASSLYIPGLTSPSLFGTLPQADPFTNLLAKHFPPQTLVSRSGIGEWRNRSLQDMIDKRDWRAIASYSRQTIIDAAPEDTQFILEHWLLRLISLLHIPNSSRLLSFELTNLFSIFPPPSPSPSRSPTRQRPFHPSIPFPFYLIQSSLPSILHPQPSHLSPLQHPQPQQPTSTSQAGPQSSTISRQQHAINKARKKSLENSAGLLRGCKEEMWIAKSEGRTEDERVWKDRAVRIGESLGRDLRGLKEHTQATKLLEDLLDFESRPTSSPSSHQTPATSEPDRLLSSVRSALVRLHIESGNLGAAEKFSLPFITTTAAAAAVVKDKSDDPPSAPAPVDDESLDRSEEDATKNVVAEPRSSESETPPPPAAAAETADLSVTRDRTDRTDRILLLAGKGDWEMAEAEAREAYEGARSVVVDGDRGETVDVTAINNLAAVLFFRDKSEESLEIYQSLSNSHPQIFFSSPTLISNLSTLLDLRSDASFANKQALLERAAQWSDGSFAGEVFRL